MTRKSPNRAIIQSLNSFSELTDAPDMAKGAVQKRAEHCNDKKLASKRVQEQSSELFFAVFVKASLHIM